MIRKLGWHIATRWDVDFLFSSPPSLFSFHVEMERRLDPGLTKWMEKWIEITTNDLNSGNNNNQTCHPFDSINNLIFWQYPKPKKIVLAFNAYSTTFNFRCFCFCNAPFFAFPFQATIIFWIVRWLVPNGSLVKTDIRWIKLWIAWLNWWTEEMGDGRRKRPRKSVDNFVTQWSIFSGHIIVCVVTKRKNVFDHFNGLHIWWCRGSY